MKTQSEKISIIRSLIPDDNLRHIIFNFDDNESFFLSDEKKYIDYFSNIMVFSMLLVWNAFLLWKKSINERNIEGNNSFWRIYNMLDKMCDPTKISGELVDDFMINLEIDCLLDTETSYSFVENIGINEFFRFDKRSNSLSKYIYLIKQRRLSYRSVSSEYSFDTFCECIKMFPYLRDSCLKYESLNVFYDGKKQDIYKIVLDFSSIIGSNIKKLDFNQTISVFLNNSAYYMEDFTVFDARRFDENGEKNQKIKLNYIEFGGRDQFSIILLNEFDDSNNYEYTIVNESIVEGFFLNYDIINTYKNQTDSTFFRDYVLLNNRYLKDLSYTISDTLSIELKDIIIGKYFSKYKEIFDKMYVTSLYNDKEIVGYRWDEIILFLLLEEGVYEFISVLLNNGTDINDFKKSFQRRFGKDKINEILKSDEFILNPESRLPAGSSQNEKIDCRTKALVMLATKLLTRNEWVLEKSIYPITIDSIITDCERVYFKSKSCENEKSIYFANIVLNVVRFISKFYDGLFQYAYSKKQAILDLETSDEFLDSYKRYSKSKEEWIENMKQTISNKNSNNAQSSKYLYSLNDINDITGKLDNAFNELILLNDKYSKCHTRENEILFDSLGRKSLFDSYMMKFYNNEIKQAILKFGEYSLDKLYNTVNDFLIYLKFGCTKDERKKYKDNYIEMAIYPIIGQYCSGVTSCDGYRYSLFKFPTYNFKDNQNPIVVKMISDDEFDFGYSYYCIPNINRIANVKQDHHYDKIWVSPIIIPCSIYLPQSINQLENLNNDDDYNDVIELIYNSDNFIYKNLFGSLENAKLVMPSLLNNPKSKFYKDYYRIIRKDKEVIAVAAIYNFSNCSWDSDIVLKAFGDVGVEVPSTFDLAIINLKETFNNYLGKMYYQIDDICVKEEYRNRGIGRSIIMNLIKIAEKSNMSVILSVYSENHIAYNLYSSLGFVPLINQKYELNTSLKGYIQMIKL